MRHLMSPLDLSVQETDKLLNLANDIEKNPEKYAHACAGKKLATCFYEPSTRTRLSFEAAMLNLGGSVLGFSSADSSSAAKGESVSDTIRVISCYADICAMRHPKEGAPLVASEKSAIPVINAGDGGHQHPTQTLTDLLTIHSLKGHLDNLTIGLCGEIRSYCSLTDSCSDSLPECKICPDFSGRTARTKLYPRRCPCTEQRSVQRSSPSRRRSAGT